VNFGCERGATFCASYNPSPGFRLLNANAETYAEPLKGPPSSVEPLEQGLW
jgi:hypothetical protein